MKEPLYAWHENTGTMVCSVEYHNKIYTGLAECHPNDEDMKSKKVGAYLAELRANRKFLQAQKNEIKIKLAALNQLYYSMKHSTHFNPKSYEAKMLFRQIRGAEDDLDIVIKMIADNRIEEQRYINVKDEFYKQIRQNRQKDKND